MDWFGVSVIVYIFFCRWYSDGVIVVLGLGLWYDFFVVNDCFVWLLVFWLFIRYFVGNVKEYVLLDNLVLS